MTDLAQQIETLKAEYDATLTWGVRWDEREDLPVGHIFEPSRVWVDNEPTEDLLPGTCAIQDKHLNVVTQFNYYVGKAYIVCGYLRGYGEDDGEVILDECEVMAIP